MDSDQAAKRCAVMWRKLGGMYEKIAYAEAERGNLERAFKAARMADVCFWHSTGENEPVVMKNVL